MLAEQVHELSENEMLVSPDYAPRFFRVGRRALLRHRLEFAVGPGPVPWINAVGQYGPSSP